MYVVWGAAYGHVVDALEMETTAIVIERDGPVMAHQRKQNDTDALGPRTWRL